MTHDPRPAAQPGGTASSTAGAGVTTAPPGTGAAGIDGAGPGVNGGVNGGANGTADERLVTSPEEVRRRAHGHKPSELKHLKRPS